MFGSFNSVLDTLSPAKLVGSVTAKYNKIKDKISNKLNLRPVLPGLIHIDFPQKVHIPQLCALTQQHAYQLWNLSEYEYEEGFVQTLMKKSGGRGTVRHPKYNYYSNLPFLELIDAIAHIQKILIQPNHLVLIHCQESLIRSAVFLSCYVFQARGGTDISEAILQVNSQLGVNLQDEFKSAYRNQHRFFKNYVNFTNNPSFINIPPLELNTVLINHPPIISVGDILWGGGKEWRVMVEVRCGEKMLVRTMAKQQVLAGEEVSVHFSKQKPVVVSDQFLILVKYMHGKHLYNAMRIQLNSNFVFNNFERVHQHSIDLSSSCQPSSEEVIFIDLTFRPSEGNSRLAQRAHKSKAQDLIDLGGDVRREESGVEHHFHWLDEKEDEIDQSELDDKIEEVMKSMMRKEEEQRLDRQAQQAEVVAQQAEKSDQSPKQQIKVKQKQQSSYEEEQQQNLDDYLSRLQQQGS